LGRTLAHPARIIPLGFLAAILLGTALLMLPAARAEPGHAPFITALFTATSAVTITGLGVVDTGTYWTGFGRTVILVLVQMGGFGIMSGATLLGLLVARRLSLSTRLVAQHETRSLGPGDVKEGSLGKLVDGYSYRLVDEAGREVPPGEIGTLEICGPSAGQGYWRMRDQSRQTCRGDAVRGSDKFHVDADGYVWFCGRGDDMLKCSGVYVSPVEVENCLLGHPAVHEAGVVGWRDAAGLEKALAFVELNAGHTPGEALAAEILAHARSSIAAFKAPRRIEFLAALPRTETGKIKRNELRKLAEALT
jgi:acyl-CoA synthetase (AMP-forming)/AMP-acid ligase II